jgi:site-specific recombinase XerC
MATDPLTDIPRKDRRENLDYVPQEGIDKLADLATADMDDFMEVRDRLTAFSLYYDFALRNREGSLLDVHDLDLADHTKISLPKAIQKIQREDSLLFSYFPETTRPLIERYLDLRARRNPRTGVLLVSDDGEPLGPDGCRNAVKGLCDRLGIKTYGGKTPTPHRLRHSFGSLNIAPLGRCLDIIEVKEQYRHSSIDTTYRLYVAKNAILKTKRYEARMRANGGGTGNGAGHIHGARQTPDSRPMPSIPIPSPAPDGFIGEDEAVRRVRDLRINYRTLREYGMKTGAVRKNGSGHEYSAEFIAGLANDYFTGQEAMDLLKMPKSSFFRWRNANGVEFIQMGQVGLYRKDLILEQKRRG